MPRKFCWPLQALGIWDFLRFNPPAPSIPISWGNPAKKNFLCSSLGGSSASTGVLLSHYNPLFYCIYDNKFSGVKFWYLEVLFEIQKYTNHKVFYLSEINCNSIYKWFRLRMHQSEVYRKPCNRNSLNLRPKPFNRPPPSSVQKIPKYLVVKGGIFFGVFGAEKPLKPYFGVLLHFYALFDQLWTFLAQKWASGHWKGDFEFAGRD